MTDKNIEDILNERYAEFHRHEAPDSVIKRFNDFSYFSAMREAQEELEVVKTSGTLYGLADPMGTARRLFASRGKLLEDPAGAGENGAGAATARRGDAQAVAEQAGGGEGAGGQMQKTAAAAQQGGQTGQIVGLYPHDVQAPQKERALHPPVLFLCWADGQNLCYIACAKNPPQNGRHLDEAVQAFTDMALAMDRTPETDAEARAVAGSFAGSGLTPREQLATRLVAIVLAVLLVIFLVMR